MRLFRYLLPVTLLLIYALIFISFFYILFPTWGHIFSSYLILSVIILFTILGDRIMLALVKAERRVPQEFRDRVDNLCYRLGASKIALYTAPELPPGIYSLKGVGDNASLIVGGNVTKILSAKEIESLLHLAIMRIKVSDLRFIQICNAALFALNGPCKYLEKFKWCKYPMMPWTLSLLPLINIKSFITNMERKQSEDIFSTVGDGEVADAIKTAHFKLLHLQPQKSGVIEHFLLYHLATVEAGVGYGHYQTGDI